MIFERLRSALGLPRGISAEERAKLRDGRNIDPRSGALIGEAAEQRVSKRKIDEAFPTPEVPVPQVPTHGDVQAATPDYYGQPMLKEPVWKWMIPTYFFVGGLAGATSAFGGALHLAGGHALKPLERRTRYLALAGDVASAGLLIADLGRPTRFLKMLRMLRITSPMSVGSWVLACSGGANAVGAVLANAPGALGGVGDAASLAGSALGLPLAGYTAVLISNSAVPLWQHTRRTLPALFIASSAASAGSALQLLSPQGPQERLAVRTLAVVGQLAELAAGLAVERDAAQVERVGRPLHEGFSAALWKGSKLLTASALALNLLPTRRRSVQVAAAAAGLAGGLALRFAVFLAGKRSARDPQAAFQAQRAGYGGAEVTGVQPELGPHDAERSYRLPVLGSRGLSAAAPDAEI